MMPEHQVPPPSPKARHPKDQTPETNPPRDGGRGGGGLLKRTLWAKGCGSLLLPTTTTLATTSLTLPVVIVWSCVWLFLFWGDRY